MAQTSSLIGTQLRPRAIAENSAAVVIPASGNTAVLDIPLGGLIDHLFVQITVAVNALDAFLVEGLATPSGPYFTITNAVTATPAGLILAASGTLATQAVGTGWFLMDVRGLQAVRISASGSTNDLTTILVRASGS